MFSGSIIRVTKYLLPIFSQVIPVWLCFLRSSGNTYSGPQYLIPHLVCMGVTITKMVTRSSTPLCSLRMYPWFRPYSRLTLQCQRRVHNYYFNQVFNTTYLPYIQLRHIMSTVCPRCDGGVCRSTFSLHAIPSGNSLTSTLGRHQAS